MAPLQPLRGGLGGAGGTPAALSHGSQKLAEGGRQCAYRIPEQPFRGKGNVVVCGTDTKGGGGRPHKGLL